MTMTMSMTRTPTTAPDAPPELPPMGRLGVLEQLRDERDEVAERAAQWCSSFKPCNAWENWLVDRIAVDSLRVERCTLQEMAMRAYLAERAKVLWDDDREVDALELARGMARAPELTRVRLELSSQGCDWLIERWQRLLPVAERGRRWDESERSLAFDLLGRDHGLRGLGSSVHGDAAMQADLARSEIARLEGRKRDRLARVEAGLRALAEQGIGPEIEKQLRALRRYEAQCLRRLEWAFAQFKKGRHAYQPEREPGRFRDPEPARCAGEPTPDGAAAATEASPRQSNPTAVAPAAVRDASDDRRSAVAGSVATARRPSGARRGRSRGPLGGR